MTEQPDPYVDWIAREASAPSLSTPWRSSASWRAFAGARPVRRAPRLAPARRATLASIVARSAPRSPRG